MKTKSKLIKCLAMIFVAMFFIVTLSTSGVEAATAKKNGWVGSGNNWKFYFADGTYAKDEILIIGKNHYVFDPQGKLVYGQNQYFAGLYVNKNGYTYETCKNVGQWKKVNGYIRWVDGSWYPKNGSYRINNTTYYFDKQGYLLTKKNGTRIKPSVKASNGKTYTIGSVTKSLPIKIDKIKNGKYTHVNTPLKTVIKNKVSILYAR